MRRPPKRVLTLLMIAASFSSLRCEPLDALYSSRAIVTGTGARNREPGFRDCLTRVLVRVSGDQRLAARPELERLKAEAGRFVLSFSYRDRLAGKPVHDEQGTYDRPHDLTCRYDPPVVDSLLRSLGSRPWLANRPRLAVFLDVERNGVSYRLSRDNPRDRAMREAFEASAPPMAMAVAFPGAENEASAATGSGLPHLSRAARAAGADLPLEGRLFWSDPDLGWVATWRLEVDGTAHEWTVRGVNFDEAFRVAIRGAAQILSGNGTP